MGNETNKNPVSIAGSAHEAGNKTLTEETLHESRRNLIKAGIVGVPVILTLKGKPAWASTSEGPSTKVGYTPSPTAATGIEQDSSDSQFNEE